MFWNLTFIWTLDFDICHSNPRIITFTAFPLISDSVQSMGFGKTNEMGLPLRQINNSA
jgi:hypothetical protein